MGTGIASKASEEYIDEEEELIFCINLSEHVKKPKDMLMFLGEYFKKTLQITEMVHQTMNDPHLKSSNKGKNKQDAFYVTADIMNYFGTACKMYLEDLR